MSKQRTFMVSRIQLWSHYFFQAIVGFRETERKLWNSTNAPVIQRIRDFSFDSKTQKLLPYVHVLDLADYGYIKVWIPPPDISLPVAGHQANKHIWLWSWVWNKASWQRIYKQCSLNEILEFVAHLSHSSSLHYSSLLDNYSQNFRLLRWKKWLNG